MHVGSALPVVTRIGGPSCPQRLVGVGFLRIPRKRISETHTESVAPQVLLLLPCLGPCSVHRHGALRGPHATGTLRSGCWQGWSPLRPCWPRQPLWVPPPLLCDSSPDQPGAPSGLVLLGPRHPSSPRVVHPPRCQTRDLSVPCRRRVPALTLCGALRSAPGPCPGFCPGSQGAPG